MPRVCVVSGYVPLNVKHLSGSQYQDLGQQMFNAAVAGGADTYLGGSSLQEMWLYGHYAGVENLPPAHDVSADRYDSPEDFVASNIVQHNRTTWAKEAMREHKDADVFVWIDLGVLKQGDFTNRRVQPEHISEFVYRLAQHEFDDIPFPGVSPKGWGMHDYEIPWRFVGSTHIWPREYLIAIDHVYKEELIRFIDRVKQVPLDLPIWRYTEERSPWLPWRQYKANHDHTQFTNYYPILPETPLCEIARFYGSDKGGRHFKAGETCHEYTMAYHQLLADKRQDVKRVLEIGVNYGCSLRMWKDYFPNADIVGFDYDPRSLFQEGRIRTYMADQSSAVSLYRALEEAGPGKFDVVIDDGSHEPEHQATTAEVVMPYLQRNGLYIIEDLHWDSRPHDHVKLLPKGYRYSTFVCPNGLGKGFDPETGGPEQLLVIEHA